MACSTILTSRYFVWKCTVFWPGIVGLFSNCCPCSVGSGFSNCSRCWSCLSCDPAQLGSEQARLAKSSVFFKNEFHNITHGAELTASSTVRDLSRTHTNLPHKHSVFKSYPITPNFPRQRPHMTGLEAPLATLSPHTTPPTTPTSLECQTQCQRQCVHSVPCQDQWQCVQTHCAPQCAFLRMRSFHFGRYNHRSPRKINLNRAYVKTYFLYKSVLP